ncbi:arginine decarboxylase, pyruvoyl-dependent [Candidatus Micrarchaeota archaeon]|nr:arginine decarboxylase, pyruvoyl-dependent [Candidatus Micrarchaeota archaeon]
MDFIPKKVFFTKGVGRATEQLTSFEFALRDAGISPFNLVSVSSILAPKAEIISKAEGLKFLNSGQVVFTVMSRCAANEPNRLIAASVGCAIPADREIYGYLSEHHAFGQTEEKAGEYAEDLAATMLASSLGVPFDSNTAWDEREQQFKMSGKFVKTMNITQSAVCDKEGNWTSVVAAAVLIL